MEETRVSERFKRQVSENNYMWRNRRRMAWAAMISIFAVTGLCFFYLDDKRLESLSSVITWFFTVMGSIVGAYMGLSTYASVASGQERPIPQDDGHGEDSDQNYFKAKKSPTKKATQMRSFE